MTHEEAVCNYKRVLDELDDDRTWEWAINEMSEEVNRKFFAAVGELINASPSAPAIASPETV